MVKKKRKNPENFSLQKFFFAKNSVQNISIFLHLISIVLFIEFYPLVSLKLATKWVYSRGKWKNFRTLPWIVSMAKTFGLRGCFCRIVIRVKRFFTYFRVLNIKIILLDHMEGLNCPDLVPILRNRLKIFIFLRFWLEKFVFFFRNRRIYMTEISKTLLAADQRYEKLIPYCVS